MSTLKTATLTHQKWLHAPLQTVLGLGVTLSAPCGAASFDERLLAAVLMAEAHGKGVVGMTAVGEVTANRAQVSPEIEENGAGVRRLLKLLAERQKFVRTYSPARGAEGELAVNSRSMLQITPAFASRLEVPEAHLKDHSAWPSPENTRAAESPRQNVRIHSGKVKPATAFAAVPYRDYWFWAENCDVQTKRALTVVMFFFTPAETGSPEKLPLITIPAQ